MGYNSACVRDISEILASAVFGVGPSNAANQILPRPTLAVIKTKFETGLCAD